MRHASTIVPATGLLLAILAPGPAAAQITRDNYLDFLPPLPEIVSQTRASVALRLFGDERSPAFRDTLPADGVDDARGRHLLRIAEHFSPLLRRNNFSVPRDPMTMLGPAPALQVDTWRDGRRIRTDSIVLAAPRAPMRVASTLAGPGSALPGRDDSLALARLLREHDPRAPRVPAVPAEGRDVRVLFFDMPGSGPATWRRTYGGLPPCAGSRVFVHPFVHALGEDREARLQLVLQYWFFYPFNDAINTREGDWEHINVVVTTRAAARGATRLEEAALDSAALARLLEGDYPVEDSLVVAAVDHYFHESVVTLDYVELGAPAAGDSTRARMPRHVWVDRDFLREVVRQRTTVAGGRLATHPMVYVGGNHKGPVELLTLRPRFHGSYRRNSGGSYPLPGVWETVGPAGAAEKMYGGVVPRVRRDSTLPWYALVDDEYVVTYRAADLTLVPDWERVYDRVATSADVARRWGWLMLPIYFGFPVGASLGAGHVRHLDVGNIPPLSPPFHPSWNRRGATTRHREYQPTVLRTPLSPTSPWSMLQSGWGALNLPLAGAGLLPGYNVALMQLMPWAAGAMHVMHAPPGRTYTPNRLPRRFTTAAPGVFMLVGGNTLVDLLPRDDPAIAARLAERGATAARREGLSQEPALGGRGWFNLYFHDRFALENTYGRSSSDARYRLATPGGGSAVVSGHVHTHRLTSGIRYGVRSSRGSTLETYARAGYGWLWYEANRLRVDDRALETRRVEGGRAPTLFPSRESWPNSWYGGVGLEAFSARESWLLGLLGYGVRIEYTQTRSHLEPAERDGGRRAVALRQGDLALSVVFGW